MRVVVAMSGGVDSSVAAALLAEAGHDVIGLSMQLYDQRASPDAFGSCCSLDDLHDARRVAASVGFPHYTLNFERQFRETVVDRFVAEYAAGRTPIPCVLCNADLKFQTLAERAQGFGASAVATGHYARVEYDEDRRQYRLLRGVDARKDQSYFLFSLTQDQLAHACSPSATCRRPTCARTPPAWGSPSPTSPTAMRSASFLMATRARSSIAGCRRRIGRARSSTPPVRSLAVIAASIG
jgi:tRNA-specific 2-thiouridylase